MLKMLKIKNNLGFSLVEVMVAMGMLGAGALTYMQIQKNSVKSNEASEARYDVSNLAQEISSIFANEQACINTFRNGVYNVGASGGNFNSIKDGSSSGGQNIFVTNQEIDGNIKLKGFHYKLEEPFTNIGSGPEKIGKFKISFSYEYINKSLNNSNTYEKKIDGQLYTVETDSSGNFKTCYFDTDGKISTTLEELCSAVGGDISNLPVHCLLQSPSSWSAWNSSTNGMSGEDIASVWDQMQLDFLPFDGTKKIQGQLNISDYLVLTELPTDDSHAVPKKYLTDNIFKCGAAEIAFVDQTGEVNCGSMFCPNGKYLVGINEDGEPICNPLVTEEMCSSGSGVIEIQSNGSAKYKCCEASCSQGANYCAGTQYESSNGCGLCNGEVPYTAGTGTYVATGQYRDVGTCVGNQQDREQLMKLECNESLCSTGCTEPEEKWVAATPVACGEPIGVCTGSSYSSAGFISVGAENRNCDTGYHYQEFRIVEADFKRGNIYTITRGDSTSEEVRPGDTPRAMLERLAAKINSSKIVGTGACGTSFNYAEVISSNTIRHRVQSQHSAVASGAVSCNGLDKNTCTAVSGCNWNTTSEYVCVGWNYPVPQGNCNGSYSRPSCVWSGQGMGMGGMGGSGATDPGCEYMYYDEQSCKSSEAMMKGCYWGTIQQNCYASSPEQCSTLGNGTCHWQSRPDSYRSCTSNTTESSCLEGAAAGYCNWVRRDSL